MKLELIKVISAKTFKNSKGNDQHVVTYYLKSDNGVIIPIKPNYELDKNAYSKLDCFADVKDKRNG